MEHHTNIVPWQLAADAVAVAVVDAPVSDIGELSLDSFEERITPRELWAKADAWAERDARRRGGA